MLKRGQKDQSNYSGYLVDSMGMFQCIFRHGLEIEDEIPGLL